MEDYKIEQLKKATVTVKDSFQITNLLKQYVKNSPLISVGHLKSIINPRTAFIFVAKNNTNKIVGMFQQPFFQPRRLTIGLMYY